MSKRKPAVSGSFYPGDADELKDMLKELTEQGLARARAFGIISPHAGYVYSGRGAGKIFSRVELPEDIIILAPNHRGMGAEVALWKQGSWLTPLGEVLVNAELGELIKTESELVEEDENAHRFEHSLEVQIPFIQFFKPDFKLVPICILRLNYKETEQLGKAIARAIEKWAKPVLIVASSDMSHYIPAEQAKKMDKLALEKILKLDPEGLFNAVLENNISMCGFIPSAVMLVSAKELGAKSAELVDYRNSGDVTGDYRQVVAYASVLVK